MIGNPTMDPLKLIIWAGLERVITSGQMAGLLDLGRAIAQTLPGATTEEKLLAFELGPENRETIGGSTLKGKVIRLRRDIFNEAECCSLPWSPQTRDLLQRYNESMPGGGGAVHPLMIVQHEVHRRLGNILDLASRNAATGEVAVSRHGLRRTGLDEEQVRQLLGDGAALYVVLD